MSRKNLRDLLLEEIEPEDQVPVPASEVPDGDDPAVIGMDILQSSELFDVPNPDAHMCHTNSCDFDIDATDIDIIESVIKSWKQKLKGNL